MKETAYGFWMAFLDTEEADEVRERPRGSELRRAMADAGWAFLRGDHDAARKAAQPVRQALAAARIAAHPERYPDSVCKFYL